MKEEILEDFLSKDARRIWSASGEVLNSVITNRDDIEALFPHLSEIRNATSGIDYGGAFLSNKRYLDKALEVIKESKGSGCLCEYAFTDYGQSVESLKNVGFILLSKKTENFITTGEVECSRCHQRYIAEEEFTGWHMTSSRHRKVATCL